MPRGRKVKSVEELRKELAIAEELLDSEIDKNKNQRDRIKLTEYAASVARLQTAIDNKTAEEREEAALSARRDFRDLLRVTVGALIEADAAKLREVADAIEAEEIGDAIAAVWSELAHVTLVRGGTGILFTLKPVGNRSRLITDAKLDGTEVESGDDSDAEDDEDSAS